MLKKRFFIHLWQINYQIQLQYLSGPKTLLADQLSRNCIQYGGGLFSSNNTVHSLTAISMSDARRAQFTQETEKNNKKS